MKRQSKSNVESPLERLPNGYLGWKLTRLKQIANQQFVNVEVPLDNRRYINCTFEHCTFIDEGTGPAEMVEDCKLIRRDVAGPNFGLRTSNPIVMASMVIQAKISQGGPGLIGIKLDPVN
jgi:hypothetical protein